MRDIACCCENPRFPHRGRGRHPVPCHRHIDTSEVPMSSLTHRYNVVTLEVMADTVMGDEDGDDQAKSQQYV
jgi:hypothetical protein